MSTRYVLIMYPNRIIGQDTNLSYIMNKYCCGSKHSDHHR